MKRRDEVRAGGRQEMSGAPGVVNKPVETEANSHTAQRKHRNLSVGLFSAGQNSGNSRGLMSAALIKLSKPAAFEMCLFVFRRLKNGGMVLTMVQARLVADASPPSGSQITACALNVTTIGL